MKDIIEKSRLKQSLINTETEETIRKNNSNEKKIFSERKKDNKRNILSERKNTINIIKNHKNITKIMKPKKQLKNIKYTILTEKPSTLLKESNKITNFNNNENNNNDKKEQTYHDDDSQININAGLIKKYVKKGSFSVKYPTKNLKNPDSSFEIFPNIKDVNLSPINPTNQLNKLNKTDIIESNIIPHNFNYHKLNHSTKLNHITKINRINKSNQTRSDHVSKKSKMPDNLKCDIINVEKIFSQNKKINDITHQCDINNDINTNSKNNNKILKINAEEVEDPFLIIPSNSSNTSVDFQPILCKEELVDLSITEEDDELLI